MHSTVVFRGSSLVGAFLVCVVLSCSKSSEPQISPPVAATCYLHSITYEGGSVTYLTYTNNLLTGWVDGNNVTDGYSYDNQSRLRAINHFPRIDSFFYDSNNRLSEVIVTYDSGKNVGEIQKYQYNSFGQISQHTHAYFSVGILTPSYSETTTFEYPNSTTHNFSTARGTSSYPGSGVEITTFKYDNKNCPHFDVDPSSPFQYLTNNIIELSTSGGYTHTEKYVFTYSEYGFPLTKAGVNENGGPWKIYYSYINCQFN